MKLYEIQDDATIERAVLKPRYRKPNAEVRNLFSKIKKYDPRLDIIGSDRQYMDIGEFSRLADEYTWWKIIGNDVFDEFYLLQDDIDDYDEEHESLWLAMSRRMLSYKVKPDLINLINSSDKIPFRNSVSIGHIRSKEELDTSIFLLKLLNDKLISPKVNFKIDTDYNFQDDRILIIFELMDYRLRKHYSYDVNTFVQSYGIHALKNIAKEVEQEYQ